MRRRRYLAALVTAVGLLTGGLTIAGPATPALAITCGTVVFRDHQAFNWVHDDPSGNFDVGGVRSGIKFRLDGDNCPFSMLTTQNQTVWIAVVGTDPTGNSVVQMGVVKAYNAIGITTTCLFWAKYGGVIKAYHCTGINDDDEINFYIHRDANKTHYVLDDCGVNTSDYSSCSTKDDSQTVWDHPVGQSSEEEQNGACDAHTFGASTDHERIGGPSGPILPLQGLADSDLTWVARSWGKQTDDNCSDPPYHYALHQSNPSPGLDFYDTRNAG